MGIGEVLLGASQKYLRSTLHVRIPQKQMRTDVREYRYVTLLDSQAGKAQGNLHCVSHQHKKCGGHSWGASTHPKEHTCMALKGLEETDK